MRNQIQFSVFSVQKDVTLKRGGDAFCRFGAGRGVAGRGGVRETFAASPQLPPFPGAGDPPVGRVLGAGRIGCARLSVFDWAGFGRCGLTLLGSFAALIILRLTSHLAVTRPLTHDLMCVPRSRSKLAILSSGRETMFDRRHPCCLEKTHHESTHRETSRAVAIALHRDKDRLQRDCRLMLLALVVMAVGLGWHCTSASAQSWITAPSYYTHDPQSGRRVDQYQQNDRVVHTPSTTRSLYRHRRSTLQVGDSIDIYHSVEQYGNPVRPYGEWRFPYRPFSVPYPQWGPTLNGAFINPGWGGPGWGGPGWGGPGGGFPGYGFPGYGGPFGPGGVINGSGFPQQWNDGYYPDVQRQLQPPQPFPVPNGPQINNNNTINGNNNTVDNG